MLSPPCHQILCTLSLLAFFTIATSQSIPVSINFSFSGTTNRQPRAIVNGFTMADFADPIGQGGQVVFKLNMSTATAPETNIQISTCYGSTFDTYLALLDTSPFSNPNYTIIAQSSNDILCSQKVTRAYLTARLTRTTYYVLLTGHQSQQGTYNITFTEQPANTNLVPWGIDRIDQRNPPLDSRYTVKDGGSDITIYLIDSGVRDTHEQLKGRVVHGHDFINNAIASAPDCTGHGTHVAGIMTGATMGVARNASIIAVRVFDCENKARISDIIDAVHWVLLNSKERSIRRSCIVALMFSATLASSKSMRTVMRSLQKSAIPVIVPSGNNAADSCDYFPSSLDTFVSVGATDQDDFKSLSSNFGNCTDIYAPGVEVLSSWHTSDTAVRVMSGTTQAAAHMAGVVAVLSSVNREIKANAVKSVLESISTRDIVQDVPVESATRFAYVRSVPNIDVGVPERGEVYIVTVIQLDMIVCDRKSMEINTLQQVFADIVTIEKEDLSINCTTQSNQVLTKQVASSVVFRFEMEEREAAAGFLKLEDALGPGKNEVQSRLGFPFTVLEMPWAYASNRYIYWGVPTFKDVQSRRLSVGQIVGIAVGSMSAIFVCGIVVWVCYRKVKTLDRVDSMEGSADIEESPVVFDNATNTENKLKALVRVMSFRKGGIVRVGSTVSMNGEGGGGLAKLESETGMTTERGANDVFRLNSFGGEAFAQTGRMDSMVDNSTSAMGVEERSMRSLRMRGMDFTGRLESQGFAASPQAGGAAVAVRLDSVGGEVFARVSNTGVEKGGDEST